MPYRFSYEGGVFRLYKIEGGCPDRDIEICGFKRENIREALEDYADGHGESSHWVGSIIKLFRKAYLFPSNLASDPPEPKNYTDSDLIRHLRSKGYLVYEDNFIHRISDKQIVDYLLSKGYTIERDGIVEKITMKLENEEKL